MAQSFCYYALVGSCDCLSQGMFRLLLDNDTVISVAISGEFWKKSMEIYTSKESLKIVL